MIGKAAIIAIACLSTLVFAQTGFCVPAMTQTQQIEQPDGTTFEARLWGDEKSHGWETADGYTIIKDAETNYWRYARKDADTQKMLPAGIVGAVDAPADISRHLRPAAADNLRSIGASPVRALPGTPEHTAVTGSRPIPVMMVNFSDTTPTFDAADFNSLLFGTGTKSLKDYYEEVSYGAFSVTPGTAGVVGWFTAAESHDYYGQNNYSGYDAHPAELVIETVTAADATVDFAEYDSDGDCYVDAVVIIHQGSGEEAGGPATDIWSHQWDLYSAAYFGDGSGVYTTNDTAACGSIKIKDYVIQPEKLWGQIQTVGVFAHEYGHVLGLPDLYDIDYSSSGIGNWGLMSGGAWGAVSRAGDSPVHMSAWSKFYLGWVAPVAVTAKLTDERIDPAATFADVYRFFPDNDTASKEYYLIENRQSIGFDAGLPATGLAVWHIDDNMASYSNQDNKQECAPPSDCTNTHYRVALVQADGSWHLERNLNDGDSGDLFPGTTGNTAFTGASYPDSYLYDDSQSHVHITGITETGTIITASLSLAYAITPSATTGGTISPGVETTLDHGDNMTFAIAADAGYELTDVLVDGSSVGVVTDYTFSNNQLDHSIRAVFSSTSANDSGISLSAGSGGSGGGGCFISSAF